MAHFKILGVETYDVEEHEVTKASVDTIKIRPAFIVSRGEGGRGALSPECA